MGHDAAMQEYADAELARQAKAKSKTAPASATGSPAPSSSTTPAPASSPSSTPPADQAPPRVARASGGARPGQALGGLIFGAFLWGYASNWISGGQAQANGWLAAKFINRPYGSASSPASAPASGSTKSAHYTKPPGGLPYGRGG